MRLIAHAKVNWSLSVSRQREDGYHLLDMLMQSVALGDVLDFEPAAELSLTVLGAPYVPSGEGNLALRAAMLLREETGVSRGAAIRLTKRIPVGAGLGGGSADAAAALVGLSRLWELDMSRERLMDMALRIGADVPFCLMGGLAQAGGVGDRLTPLASGGTFHLVIAQPCRGLSTPAVFKAYDMLPQKPRASSSEAAAAAAMAGDADALAGAMVNALHAAAVPLRPEIAICCQAMEHYGALRAQMTGSGSAVIGLFRTAEQAAEAYRSISRLYRVCYLTRTVGVGISGLCDKK